MEYDISVRSVVGNQYCRRVACAVIEIQYWNPFAVAVRQYSIQRQVQT